MMTAKKTKQVSRNFDTKLNALKKDWKHVEDAYENLVDKSLRFAQHVTELWTEAKVLDKSEQTLEYSEQVRDQIIEIIGSDSKSIFSRWVTIGQEANSLIPYSQTLPSQRDSLYQLARFKKEEKPVEEWIKAGRISSDMTVREVKALSRPDRKKGSKKRARKDRLVSVHLEFDSDYNEAAELIASIIEHPSLVSAKSDRALYEALKEILRKEGYDRVVKKLKR